MYSAKADNRLTRQAVALITVGALLFGSMLLVLKLQANVQSWLIAHHRWVQAETKMADALEIYATTGDAAFLRRAHVAMQVPLGARKARLATERKPIDRAAIREGLAQLGVDPRDMDGMTWLYLQLGHWPYVRDAIDVWLRVEPDIDRLAAIGDAIAADVAAGRLDAARGEAYRRQIGVIRTRVDGYTWEFANVLMSGLRVLRIVLIMIAPLLCVAFVLLFLCLLRGVVLRLRSSEGWLRASFDQANVGMLQLAGCGRIRAANVAACQILDIDAVDPDRHQLQDFIAARDREQFLGAMRSKPAPASAEASQSREEYRLLTAEGCEKLARISMIDVSMPGQEARDAMRFAMIEDVTEAHAMRIELARQAHYDDLTGLLNRGESLRRIGNALNDFKLGRIDQLSVCMIDLDRFRFINESAGLRVGDQILQLIAHRLHEAVGDHGEAGRLGGDQFVVLLPGTGATAAMQLSTRIAEVLSKPDAELPQNAMMPTPSIGIVAVDRGYGSASEILAAADSACERAKQAGRNRVRLLTRADDSGEARRSPAEWASELRAAITHERLELYAQRIEPASQADARRQVELLLRMRDAAGKRVTPDRFLPIAEMYGLGLDVDRHVLFMAAKAIAAHRRAGGMPMTFFVNLTPSSVAEPEFGLFVRHMLDGEPGLAPMLCFEITESGVMASLDQATAFMRMVRERGSQVALDDFGTGQSSFAQLRVLPIDIVKIDGSFVRELDRDATSEVLIRSICEMSHTLGKRTVVEWVERREDVERMRLLGADYLQGFGLHRPEPLADFLHDAG